jgi:4-hydroxybenzoyl-CoA reductase subunit beta
MTSAGAFDYHRPSRLDEAVAVLLEGGSRAALLAGGTDLVPRLKRAQRAVDVVVDLAGLAELASIEERPEGLRIGAMATARQVARHPLVCERFPTLADAARVVGAQQIREMATVGGALASGPRCQFHDQTPFWRRANGPCLRDGLGTCHATGADRCVATHACDLPVALAALEALVEIDGPEGQRRLDVPGLHGRDGSSHLALEAGEILTAVVVPWRASRLVSAYRKLRLRKAVDRPLLGLGIALEIDAGLELRGLRIAACGVGPAVRLAPGLEPFVGARLDAPLADAVARAVARWLAPSPAIRIDVEWRRAMGLVLVRRALEALMLEAARRPGPRPEQEARPRRSSEA